VRALELLDAIRPHLDGLAASLTAASPFDPATDRRIFRFGCTDAVAIAALTQLTAGLRQDAPRCDLVVRIGDYRSFPAMLAAAEVSTVLGYPRHDPPATARVRILRHSPWVLLRDAAMPAIEGLDAFCDRPAWRAATDRDPAERWFRQQVTEAFAAAPLA